MRTNAYPHHAFQSVVDAPRFFLKAIQMAEDPAGLPCRGSAGEANGAFLMR